MRALQLFFIVFLSFFSAASFALGCYNLFPDAKNSLNSDFIKPTFEYYSSDNHVKVESWYATLFDYQHYGTITVYDNRNLFFRSANGRYHINKLETKDHVNLKFSAGDYFIGELILGEGTQLEVRGEGTVRIYVRDNLLAKKKVIINENNNNLLIIGYKDVNLEKQVHFNGFLYGQTKIQAHNSVKIEGAAVTASFEPTNIKVTPNAQFVNGFDFVNMCGSVPVLAPDVVNLIDYTDDQARIIYMRGSNHNYRPYNDDLDASPIGDWKPQGALYSDADVDTLISTQTNVEAVASWRNGNGNGNSGYGILLIDAQRPITVIQGAAVNTFSKKAQATHIEIFANESSQQPNYNGAGWTQVLTKSAINQNELSNDSIAMTLYDFTTELTAQWWKVHVYNDKSGPSQRHEYIDLRVIKLFGKETKLDSFGINRINSIGQANVCVAEGISFTALDGAGNTYEDYIGTMALTTGHGGVWVVKQGQGVITYGSVNDGTASYQFSAQDHGQVVLELVRPSASNLTVTAQDGVVTTSTDIISFSSETTDEWRLESGGFTLSATGVSKRTAYQKVLFRQSYPVPPVVLLNATDEGDNPATVRIKNVTTAGFEVTQVTPPSLGGAHPQMHMTYIAIEPGSHQFPDGTKLEACVQATNIYKDKFDDSPDISVNFNHEFSRLPAVIAKLQTLANQPNESAYAVGNPWITAGADSVGMTSVDLYLDRSEVNSGSINSAEIIGYLAIDANVTGSFKDNNNVNIDFESLLTNAVVTGWGDGTGEVKQPTQRTYSDVPLWAGTKNSHRGSDGGWVRRFRNTSDGIYTATKGIYMAIDEDAYSDGERTHPSAERVGALIFRRAFDAIISDEEPILVDHYRIDYNSPGLTCQASPVTIKACVDGSCNPLFDQAVSGSLIPSGGWVSSNNINFTGSATYKLASAVPVPIELGLSGMSVLAGYKCYNNGVLDNSCNIEFSDTGFIINNVSAIDGDITTQLAGKSSDIGFNAQTIKIQAVKTDDVTGACGNLFVNGGDVDVELKYECISPNSCTDNALKLIDTNNTFELTDSFVGHQVRFGSDSSATIALTYPDVGKLNFSVQKNISLGNGQSKLLAAQSNDFVVRPFGLKLDLSQDPNKDNAIATDHNGSVFKKAGHDFNVTATAVQWVSGEDVAPVDGKPDNLLSLNDNPVAGNFTDEMLLLSHRLLSPSGGAAGVLSTGAEPFTKSIAQATRSWNEVGILGLDAAIVGGNYQGTGDVKGMLDNIGRFVPDYFELGSHDIIAACSNNYSYLGQPFSANFKVTAHNLAGDITANYQGTHAKASLTLVAENENDGQSLFSRLSAVPMQSWSSGMYTQPAFDLSLARLATPDILASTNLGLLVTDGETDVDIALQTLDLNVFSTGDCASDNSCDAKQLNSDAITLYYGRLRLKNTFGSELNDLRMPLEVQYYDGTKFSLNNMEQCVSFNARDASLDPATFGTLEPADLADQLVSVVNGEQGILLPAAQALGSVGLQLPVPLWMQFDWDANGSQDNPQAHSTFGRYRGNDRIIFWQEVR